MSKIIIAKPGVINSSKYKELKEAGYAVITAKEPSEVRIVEDWGGELSRDMLLQTAIEALRWGNDSTCRNAFGDLLRKKLEAQWTVKPKI